MSISAAAIRTGLPQQDLEEALAGKATAVFADHLGAPVQAVQEFIEGIATPPIATVLGIPMISLQPFSLMLGERGRIGLLIGCLL